MEIQRRNGPLSEIRTSLGSPVVVYPTLTASINFREAERWTASGKFQTSRKLWAGLLRKNDPEDQILLSKIRTSLGSPGCCIPDVICFDQLRRSRVLGRLPGSSRLRGSCGRVCNRTIILKIKFFFQRYGPRLPSPIAVHLTLAASINFREVENFPEVKWRGPLRWLLDKVSWMRSRALDGFREVPDFAEAAGGSATAG